MRKKMNTVIMYEVNGRTLEVFIDNTLMEKMNWSWESLMFPENNEKFALIEDVNSGELLSLITEGEVSVIDLCTKEEISIEKIKELSSYDSIYKNRRYFVEIGNHFAISLDKVNSDEKVEHLDRIIFDKQPRNETDFINLLIDLFVDYYDKK